MIFQSIKDMTVKEDLVAEGNKTDETEKCNEWFWPGSFFNKGYFQDNWWHLNGAWGLNGSSVSVLNFLILMVNFYPFL